MSNCREHEKWPVGTGLKEWVIQYETPPLRFISHCLCDAATEDEARKIFQTEKPNSFIRAITVNYPLINGGVPDEQNE